MSYGLEIRNSSDVVIIDDQYSNLQTPGEVTVSPGTSYPYTGTTKGKIVLARPPVDDDGVVGIDIFNNEFYEETFVYPNAASYLCHFADTFEALGVSGNSGYGLNVYNSSGDITYGATYRDTSVELIDVGEMLDGNTNMTITLGPYSGYLDECYVMINNTKVVDQSFFGSFFGLFYSYDWDNDQIIVNNLVAPSGINPGAYGKPFTYAVYRIRGL